MLWLKLIEGILDLNIVQDDVCSKHSGNSTSADFLTKSKLRFTVEVVDDEVSLVFREYGAEVIKIIWGGKVISNSVYGQEQKIIKRINKILRKIGLFYSFDELDEDDLKLRQERKFIWNKRCYVDDVGE